MGFDFVSVPSVFGLFETINYGNSSVLNIKIVTNRLNIKFCYCNSNGLIELFRIKLIIITRYNYGNSSVENFEIVINRKFCYCNIQMDLLSRKDKDYNNQFA